MGIIPKVVIAAIFTYMAVLECSGVQIKIISFNIQNFGKPEKLWDDIALRNVSAPAMELSQVNNITTTMILTLIYNMYYYTSNESSLAAARI